MKLPKNMHMVYWNDLYGGNLFKRCKHFFQLNQIHAQLLVRGFYGDDSIIAKLIDCLFANKKPELASSVFKWRGYSNILWTSMIKGYSCFGSFKESLAFYVEMRRGGGIFPNNFNIPFALKSCAALKALSEALQIHSDVVKLGFVSNVFVQTALLDMYAKCGRMEIAKKVFDDMSVKNVVSWTVMVDGYCRLGILDQAQKLFHEMPIRNIVTWNVMVDGLTRFGDLETAQWYFDHMPQRSIASWTIMIGGYSRAGNVDKARLLFDQMHEREVVAWTAMITCYVDNGKPEEAIKLFREMLEANLKLDAVTMLTVISAVSQLRSLHLCAWIHNCVTERGFRFDLRIQNAIINMYMQCGNIEKAFEIFEKMPTRDVISYNSMITGYATHGDAKQAFSLFSTMNRENVLPSSITFIGVLSACAHGGLVEEGRRYFRLMLDLHYVEVKAEHYACMVDLLGRAGYLEEAHNLILSMPIKPSASTWGALLGACKIHGNIVLAEVVAQKLFQMEPENSGNYAVLANMYADKRMWNSAAKVRRVMEEKSLHKTPGSSWAEKYNASAPVLYPIRV